MCWALSLLLKFVHLPLGTSSRWGQVWWCTETTCRQGARPRGEGQHTWALGAWPGPPCGQRGLCVCGGRALWQRPSLLAGAFLLKRSHSVCGFLSRLSCCVCSRSCFPVPARHSPRASPMRRFFPQKGLGKQRPGRERLAGRVWRGSQPESEGRRGPWGTGPGTGIRRPWFLGLTGQASYHASLGLSLPSSMGGVTLGCEDSARLPPLVHPRGQPAAEGARTRAGRSAKLWVTGRSCGQLPLRRRGGAGPEQRVKSSSD